MQYHTRPFNLTELKIELTYRCDLDLYPLLKRCLPH